MKSIQKLNPRKIKIPYNTIATFMTKLKEIKFLWIIMMIKA